MKILTAKIVITVLLIFSFSACSLKKAATTTIGKIAVDGTTVIESEEDVALARSTTPSLIVTLEVLSQGNPKDKRMLTLLARSYGQYAFGFLEEDLIHYKGVDEKKYEESLKRANLFYRRGKEYGLKALWPEKEQERVFSLPQDEFVRELSKFGKNNVSSLFWAAFCFGNWINLNRDDPAAFIHIPRVKAMMERVIRLDPSYYYGSAHTFLGAIASSRPKMLGGDLGKARSEFDEAVKINDQYLMHKVLYAQYYAVGSQDKKLFERLLNDVAQADAQSIPKQRLANELAKRRAVFLMQNENRYF